MGAFHVFLLVSHMCHLKKVLILVTNYNKFLFDSSSPVPHVKSIDWVITGSGKGLSPVRRQATNWTSGGL